MAGKTTEPITVYLNEAHARFARARANEERRSLSNYLAMHLEQALEAEDAIMRSRKAPPPLEAANEAR